MTAARHVAALILITTAPAAAGDDATHDVVLDNVVVTARKLEERVFAVPLAIDVFGVDALRARSIDTLSGLAAHAPGLGFEAQFGASGGVPTLRGQSQPAASGDNVAVFVDGVYQANRGAIDVEMLDFERIELLRGPQSTLFGHSAFAGAIQYVSRAPTHEPALGVTLEGGSDDWFGAQGFVTGPLAQSGWLGRIAASYRRADGTHEDASSGRDLGGFERRAVVATLAHDADGDTDWIATLSLRHTASDASHPAVEALTGDEYNCGSRNPASGLWSYYCGRAPVARRFDLSDDLPDSMSRATQVLLKLALPLGAARLESDTSYYSGRARILRDFDGTDGGLPFGVCTKGVNCPASGRPPAMVDRLVDVEQVLAQRPRAREFSQELRLRGDAGERIQWLLGAVYFETRERTWNGIGAARGDLAANEQLTALLPGSPQVAGPLSQLNRALVDDPASSQINQALNRTRRRTQAAYAALDWHPLAALGLRAELRRTRERLELDSVTANFLPSFGTAIPARKFHDTTPRFSVDYAWTEGLRSYASVAKGSRSGGINAVPGLAADEQVFAPESNWTYELGLRYASHGWLRRLAVTGYGVDWRDTQIPGFSASPGITNLITRNTAGVRTRGIEASLVLEPVDGLRGEFDYSRVDAHFKVGSEDPGAAAFCGLTATISTSTLCTVGPPRNPSPNSPALVPWLDDNFVSRAPRSSWHGALVFTPPPLAGDWRLQLRTDLSHQGAMYERAIEGLSFGARTLLDARVTASRGPWSLELWGRNLTDERYIRSSFSRQPGFYPTQPRPMDMIYGDGRRFGVTIRYAD